MSDNLLKSAPFLPASAPASAVNDYSGTLSPSQLSALETQAKALTYKVKVVVLPKDFTSGPLEEFARQLASQWHADSGRKMLLVVDLKAHKVRALTSPELSARGFTSDVLSQQVIPEFVAYMRKGDLQGAISHTLASVNQGRPVPVAVVDGRPQGRGDYGGHNYASGDGTGWVWQWGLLAVFALAVFGMMFKSRADKNKKLEETFNEKANLLYEKADQIGQASEYLDVSKHNELAQRVALFFNKVTTLEKAKNEVDRLRKKHHLWQAGDGLINCIRLTERLDPEADQVLSDLNSVTGGVQTFAPVVDDQKVKRLASDGDKIAVPVLDGSRVRRPTWTYEPAYQPAPVMVGPGGGLFEMMFLLNQMDMNHRLDRIDYDMHHGQYNDGGGSAHEGWGGGAGGGSWGDDSGSSGGDSGGGDGGGDWGGGGDFGGGDAGGDW